ncbi:MAG: TlpA family protein disulfide reductase [Ferruginibacter sp.]|nr:TlpA family protein disulfide reductase [Chitinophagaceae bacterium]MBP6286056.1 TlpA family protein disulfide reductase [Ferruginibacter sp.]MBU9937356.1 TlpA family protein disulfide reductase [Ferruginibacter sp.]
MKTIFLVMLILMGSLFGRAQLRVGETVPEIELPGIKDSIIRLSSLNGKVILIDFWASWCGPCRAANPYLQKLYSKYKDKGFEIFAVSLDTKSKEWLKAIKQDKLRYTQVIDNSGWRSKVAERYFVDQLPTSFLLDRTGKIVAIDLEGKELFDQVKRLVQ